MIGVVVVAGALVAVGFGYTIARAESKAGNGPAVLISAPSYAWLPNGQFNAVTFVVQSSATLAGTFSNTHGLVLYLMNTTQFYSLTRTNVPSSYNWTSGSIPSLVRYNLSIAVSSGTWNLVFFNPSTVVPSGVDFWSPVTETLG